MNLPNKYRPQKFRDVAGNSSVIKNLIKMAKHGNLPQTFLFTGPEGCGKTTMGRIIANAVGAKGRDLVEINTADFRGVDTIRGICSEMRMAPVEPQSKKKLYLIDESHQLGVGGDSAKNVAQNAFLKALEEPPAHVIFVLCTTNPNMLLKTIRSRCSVFDLQPLSEDETIALLKKISKKEGKEFEEETYNYIQKVSQGKPRKAVNILGKLLESGDKNIKELVEKEDQEEVEAIELARALMKGESWNKVSKIVKSLLGSNNPENIRRLILGYMKSVQLNKGDEHSFNISLAFLEHSLYDCGDEWLVAICSAICNGYDI